MVSKMHMLVLMVLLGAAIRSCGAQTTHAVGGSLGWTVPNGNPTAYSTWAGNQTFAVGDTLAFNFSTGAHDVAEVNKAAYDGCTSTSTISLQNNGPASITLNKSGEHYFICTFSGHCNVGQKLAINVTNTSAPTPSPSPAPTPSSLPPAATPTPTPTPSSSSPPPAATPPPSASTPPPSPTPAPSTSTPPPSPTPAPSASTSPPPPPAPATPSPTGSTPPPSPGNSAASLSVTGLFSGILSIAVALLY